MAGTSQASWPERAWRWATSSFGTGKAVAAAAALTVPSPKLGEQGFTGTAIYSGDILGESNLKLIHERAYGTPGTRNWGEWEKADHTDESVHKGLDFVMAPIRDARLDVEEADEDDATAKAQGEFVRNVFEQLGSRWRQESCRGALLTGFALHEEVWGEVKDKLLPNGGNGVGITRMAERLPSSIHPNGWLETEGQLTAIRQLGPVGHQWKTIDLPASKVFLNTWDRNGNNYLGYSVFRAVWYLIQIRAELARIIGVSHVREGAGIPIAWADEKAVDLTPSERASLQKWLANIVYHENANIIMPRGWKLEWLFSPGSNKGHLIEAFNHLGQLILMQVGAQQLALGLNGTGSRSVGEVHSDESLVFVNGVCANWEFGVNGIGDRPGNGMVKRLIDFNWGPPPSGKYPKVKLTLKKPKLKPLEKAQALKTAKDAGLFTPTFADENEFREDVGLAPIEEDEREKEKEKARALAPPSPFGKPSNDDAEKKPFEMQTSAFSATQPKRALRETEKVIDFTAVAKVFDTRREDFVNGVRPLVAELLMRALPAVKAAMADSKIAPEEIAGLKLETARLEAFIGDYIETLRADGFRAVRGEMQRAQLDLRVAMAQEDDKSGAAPEYSPAADEAQAQLEPMRKHLARKIANRLKSDLEREAIEVIRRDGDPEEVVSLTLERQVTGGGFKSDAGIVTTKAFNVGREEFAEQYGDQVESVELTAYLDSATCGPCERLDGQEFDFNSAEHVEHVPPLSSICNGGDNCRCFFVYNFKRAAA